MEQTKTISNNLTRYKTKEPEQYNVIMHNDGYTTMDFVIKVLVDIFKKQRDEAERLMMKIHKEGKAVVGRYLFDIACSKAKYAMTLARQNGFPLKLTVEKE